MAMSLGNIEGDNLIFVGDEDEQFYTLVEVAGGLNTTIQWTYLIVTISMLEDDSSGEVDMAEEADEPWAMGILTWECLRMDEEEEILEALDAKLEVTNIVEGVEEAEEVKEWNGEADNAEEAETAAGLVDANVDEEEEGEESVTEGEETFVIGSLEKFIRQIIFKQFCAVCCK